jgi:hypothetical protein
MTIVGSGSVLFFSSIALMAFYYSLNFGFFGIIFSGLFSFVVVLPASILIPIYFSLAPIILIEGDSRGINALLKSKKYMESKWGFSFFWRMFVVLFPLSVLFSIFESILNSFDSSALNTIFAIFYLGFFVPLISIFTYLVYKNIKEVRGNIDFEPKTSSKVLWLFMGITGYLLFWLFFLIGQPFSGLNLGQ